MADKPLPIINEAVKDRFWAKVKIGKHSECWNWQAATSGFGYGMFGCKTVEGKFITYHAHQFSLIMHSEGRPSGAHCCHTCDNPKCVNPSHLWWGSCLANMRDKEAKGRGRKQHGTANNRSRITEKIVRYIRASEKPNKILCKELGLGRCHVSKIRSGRLWGHVA